MKRILTMQDLSCVGQCSLTVALPILSAYGIETCVLPTAVLSNHTMFKSWSYLDLTPEIPAIFENWQKNEIKFDGFLLGYLGKSELMEIAEQCFKRFSEKNSEILIDPVFGDDGRLYGGFDMEYVKAMRKLIGCADIILPNMTEACFLTDTEYRKYHDKNFALDIAEKLRKFTDALIILTGVEIEGKIGELIYCNDNGEFTMHTRLPAKRHGTGDIFSSVFTANHLAGKDVICSVNRAAEFVAECLKRTGDDHFYGVHFEEVLNKLL